MMCSETKYKQNESSIIESNVTATTIKPLPKQIDNDDNSNNDIISTNVVENTADNQLSKQNDKNSISDTSYTSDIPATSSFSTCYINNETCYEENLKKLSKSILAVLYLLEKEAQIHFNMLKKEQHENHLNKIERVILSFLSKSSAQLEKLRAIRSILNEDKSLTKLQLKMHKEIVNVMSYLLHGLESSSKQSSSATKDEEHVKMIKDLELRMRSITSSLDHFLDIITFHHKDTFQEEYNQDTFSTLIEEDMSNVTTTATSIVNDAMNFFGSILDLDSIQKNDIEEKTMQVKSDQSLASKKLNEANSVKTKIKSDKNLKLEKTKIESSLPTISTSNLTKSASNFTASASSMFNNSINYLGSLLDDDNDEEDVPVKESSNPISSSYNSIKSTKEEKNESAMDYFGSFFK